MGVYQKQAFGLLCRLREHYLKAAYAEVDETNYKDFDKKLKNDSTVRIMNRILVDSLRQYNQEKERYEIDFYRFKDQLAHVFWVGFNSEHAAETHLIFHEMNFDGIDLSCTSIKNLEWRKITCKNVKVSAASLHKARFEQIEAKFICQWGSLSLKDIRVIGPGNLAIQSCDKSDNNHATFEYFILENWRVERTTSLRLIGHKVEILNSIFYGLTSLNINMSQSIGVSNNVFIASTINCDPGCRTFNFHNNICLAGEANTSLLNNSGLASANYHVYQNDFLNATYSKQYAARNAFYESSSNPKYYDPSLIPNLKTMSKYESFLNELLTQGKIKQLNN
jgi:hypothetical protein